MTSRTKVVFTPKMELLDVLLRQKKHMSLRRFLTLSRRPQPGTGLPLTWDDIAYRAREATGQRIVRESMITYARKFGLAPERVLAADEEIDDSQLDLSDPDECAESLE